MADQLRVPGNLCIPEVGWWMILRDFGENLMFRVFEWRSELQVLLSASTQKAVKAQVKFSSTFIISHPPPSPILIQPESLRKNILVVATFVPAAAVLVLCQ